jgi:hypothetical protein
MRQSINVAIEVLVAICLLPFLLASVAIVLIWTGAELIIDGKRSK